MNVIAQPVFFFTFKRVNEEVDLDNMVSPAGGYICPG